MTITLRPADRRRSRANPRHAAHKYWQQRARARAPARSRAPRVRLYTRAQVAPVVRNPRAPAAGFPPRLGGWGRM